MPYRNFPFVGEWLSLVEHLVRDQGVGGSNPLSPTNLSQRAWFGRHGRIQIVLALQQFLEIFNEVSNKTTQLIRKLNRVSCKINQRGVTL